MRKLNKKGFTLVELLAVIIILAIVVGITIPAVLTTTGKAKEKAFKNAASIVADWVDRQYTVAKLGTSDIATLDSNFSDSTNGCGSDGSGCTGTSGKDITNASFITAAGVSPSNVTSINVKINSATGRSCVTLTAKNGGDYYGYGTGDNKDTMQGGVC